MIRKYIIRLVVIGVSMILAAGSLFYVSADESIPSDIYMSDDDVFNIDDTVDDTAPYVEPVTEPVTEPATQPVEQEGPYIGPVTEPTDTDPQPAQPVTQPTQPATQPAQPDAQEPANDADDNADNDARQANDQNDAQAQNVQDNTAGNAVAVDNANNNAQAEAVVNEYADAVETVRNADFIYADDDLYIAAIIQEPDSWPENAVMVAQRVSKDQDVLLEAMNNSAGYINTDQDPENEISDNGTSGFTADNTWFYSIIFYTPELDENGAPTGAYSIFTPEEGSVTYIWQYRKQQLTGILGAEAANDISVVPLTLERSAVTIADDGGITALDPAANDLYVGNIANTRMYLNYQIFAVDGTEDPGLQIPGSAAFFYTGTEENDRDSDSIGVESDENEADLQFSALGSETDDNKIVAAEALLEGLDDGSGFGINEFYDETRDSGETVIIYAVTNVVDKDKLIDPFTVSIMANDEYPEEYAEYQDYISEEIELDVDPDIEISTVPSGYYLISVVTGVSEGMTTLQGTYYHLKPIDESILSGVVYSRHASDVQLAEDYIFVGDSNAANYPGFGNAIQTLYIIKSTDGSELTVDALKEGAEYEIVESGDAFGDYIIERIDLEDDEVNIVLDDPERMTVLESAVAAARAKIAEQESIAAAEQASREAEELASKEAEEQASREAEEASKAAEEQASREAEELASKEAEEQASRKAEELASKEAEEQASREAEEQLSENEVLFKGSLSLEGRNITEQDTFRFAITEDDKAFAIVYSDAEGNIDYPVITYKAKEEGVHIYTVKALAAEGQGIIQDDTEYTVEVTVTASDDGTVKAEITGGDDASALDFSNTYEAGADVIVSGRNFLAGSSKKSAEDGSVENGEDSGEAATFATESVTYTIEAVTDGAPMPELREVTVTNAEGQDDASFSFGTIHFSSSDVKNSGNERTFEYNVTGTDSNANSDSRTMKVTVRDNRNGKLAIYLAKDSDADISLTAADAAERTTSGGTLSRLISSYGLYAAIALVVILIIIVFVVVLRMRRR